MGRSISLPNVFIIGAPKCGTTAMATWLSEHPHVFLPRSKEPSFFSSDIEGGVSTLRAYEALYKKALPRHSVILDASTQYLRSKVAVPQILQLVPRACFIVMLRNPIEMAQAWHQEMVFNFEERETSFQLAWRLQERRAKGLDIPRFCRNPQNLLLKDVCSTGQQLQRVLNIVKRERILVLLFDDLCSDPRECYRSVLKFLSLPNYQEPEFRVINRSKAHRVRTIAHIAAYLGRLKARVGIQRSFYILDTLRKINLRRVRRPALSEELFNELASAFEADIRLTETILGRNLSDWRRMPDGLEPPSFVN